MSADPEPAPTVPDDPNHPQPKPKNRKRKRAARQKASHPEEADHGPVDEGPVNNLNHPQSKKEAPHPTDDHGPVDGGPVDNPNHPQPKTKKRKRKRGTHQEASHPEEADHGPVDEGPVDNLNHPRYKKEAPHPEEADHGPVDGGPVDNPTPPQSKKEVPDLEEDDHGPVDGGPVDNPNPPQPKTKKRKRKRGTPQEAPHPAEDDHSPVDGGLVDNPNHPQPKKEAPHPKDDHSPVNGEPVANFNHPQPKKKALHPKDDHGPVEGGSIDNPNHPQPKTKKKKRKRGAHPEAPHPEETDHGPVDGGSVPIKRQQQVDADKARQTALSVVSAPPPEALSLRLGTAIPSNVCADQGYQLVPSKERQAVWRISNPMGGRIADIDPILTQGDKYLILSYYTSIQVYSAEDSLLVRRIPIPGWPSAAGPPPIVVATRQSRVSPNLLWVATSDGHVLQIDWTIPPGMAGACLNMVRTHSQTCRAMAVLAIPFGKHKDEDVLIVAENDSKQRSETSVHAYRTAASSEPGAMWCELGHLSVEAGDRGCIPVVETSQNGLIVAVALAQTIYVASLAGVRGKKSLASWHFQSYTFDGSDLICALDLRISDRPGFSGPDWAHVPVVDLIAGGARGAIYLYNDVLARLTKPGSARENLQARKLHWHRRAVHALKWSRDGNYMISGGSENALVIWQMDTGQRDYLPHLAASVENIAVSADGSSYLVHLDDNSVMVLSTAELKPTVYVAGLQSGVRMSSPRKDELVRRVWSTTEKKATKAGGPAAPAVTAAISPKDPLKLHLCVGSGQQGSTVFSDPTAPAPTPWLQSFDLASFRTETRQAIARTHATENNITSDGYPIRDPTVTHMQFSADGRWLATADEWEPAPRDVADMAEIGRSVLLQQRREVYLKFWQVGAGTDEPLGLVSRISAPHSTDHAEPVLDLVAAPKSAKFATVAGDGMVRLWRPVAREQDGIRVKDGKGRDMHRWICSRAVDLGSPHETELLLLLPPPESTSLDRSEEEGVRSRIVGSLAFSEDGSILFAALGGEAGDGTVRLIDADSGRVRHTIRALWRGSICRMASLSSYLIVVSDRLVSYSILTGQLVYSIELPPLRTYAERNLVQLAVDRTLGRVGVVVPNGNRSDMGIFQPDNGKDAFMHTLPHTVLCTIAPPVGSGLSGFLMLDDAAQLSTVSAPSEHEPIQVLRPLEDIRLVDGISGAVAGSGSIPLPIQVEMEVDDEIASEDGGGRAGDDEDVDGGGDGNMDEAADPVVVSREGLASIFSTAPAFAMPPIEDLFFKVAALVGQKPVEVYRAGQAGVGAGVASSGVDRSGRAAAAVA